jgi:hypothetical protein
MNYVSTPEKHIFQRLATTPAVARLVGFQIFPIAVPKNATMPFAVYRRNNIIREATLSGPVFSPTMNLQISSWAMTYEAARELANEIRVALDGYTGTLCGVTIGDVRLVSEADDYLDPSAVGTQLPPAYEVRQLFQVRWSEATE